MTGSVLAVMLVAIVFVLVVGLTPFLLIPIVVIGLAALFALPLILAAKDTSASPGGAGPSGVPTTGEASYNPVRDPGERPTTG